MPTVGLFNQERKQVGDIQLNDNVFGAGVNTDAMHQVVIALLANKRQGAQSARTRAGVRGDGIKLWRQKGIGRARQDSIRTSQWIKGGIVFAPEPRDYKMLMPESMGGVAMKSALTSKVQDGQMVVLRTLVFEAPKTKKMVEVLKALGAEKTLIMTEESNEVLYKSARNITDAQIVPVNNINVYDLLKSEKLTITKDAISRIEEVYT